ncbi:hypothetical protein R3P38DRAFT_2845484, partial [Favolaschia claudopus]
AATSRSQPRLSIESVSSASSTESQDVVRTPPPIPDATTVSPEIVGERRYFPGEIPGVLAEQSQEDLVQKPFIHDPGNGHRVRDTRAFLIIEEVLQMLCTVLPEETALYILWYNKSRLQRLYRLGDVLSGHTDFTESEEYDRNPINQELSGSVPLISAIKSAWGHSAEEMDEGAWQDLNSAGEGHAPSPVGVGLGMLVRMTRLHDLGLAQLCLPDVDFEAESTVPTERGHTWTEAYVSEAPQADPLRV